MRDKSWRPRTRHQQKFFCLSLLQWASPVLLISAAAESLQGLVDHSLQLPCLLIKSLLTQRPTLLGWNKYSLQVLKQPQNMLTVTRLLKRVKVYRLWGIIEQWIVWWASHTQTHTHRNSLLGVDRTLRLRLIWSSPLYAGCGALSSGHLTLSLCAIGIHTVNTTNYQHIT